jgi:hypothetical protein
MRIGPRSTPPLPHGGYQGRAAELYDNAYAVYFELGRQAATESPGLRPVLYPIDRAFKKAAIGDADPRDPDDHQVVYDGCADGFRDALEAFG